MSDILKVLVVVLAAVVAGILGWWLLIATEGVYLGRRVVGWLYDAYAHRYDGVKNYYREYEHRYLAQPIMDAIAPHQSPLVLDIATGTGRIPLALMRHSFFQGRVVGLDISRRMLRFATKNLYVFDDRTHFIWGTAEKLPFPDNSFDVVTCLEALEFMTRPKAVLQEMVRVLRPGGLLLVSQRINTKLMPGKTWTAGEFQEVLAEMGVEDAHAQIWQVDYRKIWGKKAGNSLVTGARPLAEVLRCPRCQASRMEDRQTQWVCGNCRAQAAVGTDGVIELWPLE
ncbi:MAG TPA: methyltransferase domain-containing protein [Phototrophicaceae bacterium]|nr:methyltransferase domain-containing protein [Phototrophicaceae bacterium]